MRFIDGGEIDGTDDDDWGPLDEADDDLRIGA